MFPPLSVMDFQQIDTNQAYLAWSLSQNRKTGGCKKQWAQFVFASLHTTSPHSAYCMKIWLGSTTYAQECTTWLLPIIVSTLRHMSVTEPNLPWFCNEITVQCTVCLFASFASRLTSTDSQVTSILIHPDTWRDEYVDNILERHH